MSEWGKLSSFSVLQLYSRCHCKHFSLRIFLFKCTTKRFLLVYVFSCVSVRLLQVCDLFSFIRGSFFHVFHPAQQWISFQYLVVQMLTHTPSSETVKFDEKEKKKQQYRIGIVVKSRISCGVLHHLR